MKLYLEKNRNTFSNNVEGVVNTTLSTKNRLLPNNDISTTFSTLEQYNRERDNCRSFRLIFNINPICSNVLFNMKSEIVWKEGSEEADCLPIKNSWVKNDKSSGATNSSTDITYLDGIRNTEYSHPELGNFVYHCGVDIFNNHMLRNNGFIHVNKTNSGSCVYNTIEDILRYEDGSPVKQKINPTAGNNETEMHLYRYDSILSFKKAFSERCEERDGWWGFINPSVINISNRENNSIRTNQMLANNKPCEFIDFYPDRSLFSFNPKYNKYRRRIEKNWDYCITYPYESDQNLVNTICGSNNGSIKILCSKEYNTNGIEVVKCESYFNHNLKVGDNITIFYKDDNGIQTLNKKIRVVRVGDFKNENHNKVFYINYSDIKSIYHYNEEGGSLFFKKNVNGVDCIYYARKFKSLGDLNSDINKVAFGKNIYGDATSQIIFTDDINIDGLIDNNGRPVSEVYLTIVKRNKGHKEWYDSGSTSKEEVEYSHCFGEVTSGLDFSGIKDEPDDYNVHKTHNVYSENITIPIKNTIKVWGESLGSIDKDKEIVKFKVIKNIEDDITINENVFYGDIVEYNIIDAKETIISPIYHRFNTKQRETFNENFMNIIQDVITSDDYDSVLTDGKPFNVDSYYINTTGNNKIEYLSSTSNVNSSSALTYGNIFPEGYFYNPHYNIRLIEEAEEVLSSEAKLINYSIDNLEINNNEIKLIVPTNFGFYKGDYVAFFNEEQNNTYWLEIKSVSGNNLTFYNNFSLEENDFYKIQNDSKIKLLKAYWSLDNVPIYAKFSLKDRKFFWRKLIPQSDLTSRYNLYETPFTNGRLYIEKNINFFLRRQDPTGKYGLSVPIYRENNETVNPMTRFIIKGYEPYDFTINEVVTTNLDNCY